MPNIRTYTNPIDKIEPSELGASAWDRSGYLIDRLLTQAGNRLSENYTTAGRDISQAYLTVAQTLREGSQTIRLTPKPLPLEASARSSARPQSSGPNSTQIDELIAQGQEELDAQANQSDVQIAEFNATAKQRQQVIDQNAPFST